MQWSVIIYFFAGQSATQAWHIENGHPPWQLHSSPLVAVGPIHSGNWEMSSTPQMALLPATLFVDTNIHMIYTYRLGNFSHATQYAHVPRDRWEFPTFFRSYWQYHRTAQTAGKYLQYGAAQGDCKGSKYLQNQLPHHVYSVRGHV